MLAFARELLRVTDDSHDADLELKARVWIVRQNNVSNGDESEYQKLKVESAVRLFDAYADRPELATCALNVIRLLPVTGYSVDVWQNAALKLLKVNPDKTVQAIACYEAAESQLAPRGYNGKGGAPDPGAIEKAIPLLERDCCSIGSGSALGETEHSRRLLKQAGSEKTATITVLYDDLDQARKNLEKLSNPAVLIAGDEAVRFFRLWNVQGWPTAFIIDAKGNLRAKRIRGTVIAEVLTELLDQPPLRESNK